MKHSASIEVVVRLAGQEIVTGRFAEIGLEHVLIALMKLAELPTHALGAVVPGTEVANQLTAEVHALRHELASRGIDCTQSRRRLRADLGRGTCESPPQPIHRSEAAKRVFDEAARLAREEHASIMTAVHLLKALLASPTPAMVKVLGDALAKQACPPGSTPLLDAYGIDVTKMAAEDKLVIGQGSPAERSALSRLLAERRRAGVLLIGEEQPVCGVIAGVAGAIGRGIGPATLRGTRIIDVGGLTPAGGEDCRQAIERLGLLVAEASRAGNVMLVLRSPAAAPSQAGSSDWGKALKAILAEGKVMCLFLVPPAQYAATIQQDLDWRRLAHVMWVGGAIGGQMPEEL